MYNEYFTNEFSQQILDSLAEGIFTIDKEFKIKFINKAAEGFTGLKKGELFDNLCKRIFKSELCKDGCPITRVLETGENVYDLRSKIINKDGVLIPVILNAALLKDINGEPTGGVISLRRASKEIEVEGIQQIHSEFHGIIGKSKVMQDLYNLINEVSASDAPVLIYGETGVGKELIANAVQETSKRANKKFVKINCAVFPPDLLASELFGHVKGAFTDAFQNRIGRFEYAGDGTIFLDEIEEMPIQMQSKLLRVLQDGTFEPLGDSKTRKVDVRIIAATNKDLKNELRKKNFREDLFYRLNVIPIDVPPLRERPEDIPLLVNYLMKKFSFIYKKELSEIEGDALDILMQYKWPGNIRELENAIEYSFVRSNKYQKLVVCSLPAYLRKENCIEPRYFKKTKETENEYLIGLLEEHNWNKSKVAKVLGINRTTLWRHLKSIETEL